MFLTNSYRNVKSVSRRDVIFNPDSRNQFFSIGPLLYRVSFYREEDPPGFVEVVFTLRDIKTDDPQVLSEILSKIHKTRISPEEAIEWKKKQFDRDSVLGVGNASGVFSYVLSLMKRYQKMRHPRGFAVWSTGASRSSLYARLIQRFFSGCRVIEKIYGDHTHFYIYLES